MMMQPWSSPNDPLSDTELTAMDEVNFARFRELVRAKTGIALRPGKQVMLASRLNRRLRAHGFTSFEEYYAFLTRARTDSDEMLEFINCVTTNKTALFREPHHFEFLRKRLIPEAARRASLTGERRLRIWSAASSTGEEPYSIATTLLAGATAGWKLEVLGSDIDTSVLETAQRGIYPAATLDGMNPHFCRAYFQRGTGAMEGMVRVKPEVQRIVSFQRINLIDATWPVEGKLDAIFFRNALIYFERKEQERFLRRMVRLLRPDGYLFLGHSEHVPWLYDVVEAMSNTIFQVRRPAAETERTKPCLR